MSLAGDLRALVRLDGFARIFATRLTAQASDGLFQAGLASVVLFNPQQATRASSAAAGFVVLFLPYSLIGPFAGVLIDRWRRARVLVVANLARAAILGLTLALMVALGPTSLPFYVSALAAIGVNRFFLSALGASLPEIVPASQLVGANSVTTTLGFAATVTGGAVGVGLAGVAGHHGLGRSDAGDALVTALAALGYLVSGAVARGFAPGRLGPSRPVRVPARTAAAAVLTGFRHGLRHLRTRPPAQRALSVLGVHRVAYGMATVMIVLLYGNTLAAQGVLATGLAGAAQAVVAGGAGAVLSAVITPIATRRMRESTWIVLVMLVAAVGVPAAGLTYTPAGIVTGSFLLGACAQGLKICVDTILQRTIDEPYLGRIFSLADMVFNLAFVAAAVLAALVLPQSGRSPAVVLAVGLGYAVGALAYLAASRRDGPAAPATEVAGAAEATS